MDQIQLYLPKHLQNHLDQLQHLPNHLHMDLMKYVIMAYMLLIMFQRVRVHLSTVFVLWVQLAVLLCFRYLPTNQMNLRHLQNQSYSMFHL